jgi:predicted acylesterase/phospholipase RssA
VSAGALIAPFAFLGSAYDRQLTEIFNRYGGDDIYESAVLAGALGGNAIASSAPLKRLIDKFVTPQMVAEIAASCANGRMLLVSTTNLDAERPVFWDVCKIARRGNRQAVELIRSILLASASIPGVFPPVRIKVVANGRHYEELHVDGGPTRQVFLSPNGFRFGEIDKAIGRKIKRNLYIIRNGKIGPEFEETRENLLAIGQRSLYTTLKYQALGDLARIHAKAKADGIDFHLAAIPDDFRAVLSKPFDSAYMKALYRVGHQLGREGQPWLKSPVGGDQATSTRVAR